MPAPPLNPRLHALYGRTPPSATDDGPQTADLEARVDRLLHEPGWSPPLLPEVGRELLESSQRRVDAAAARRVLGLDPLVTARMVQRAQREAGRRRAVLTLQDVVEVVGPDGVGRLTLELATTGRMFRATGYQEAAAAVRRHAQASAAVAAMLAELIPHAATHPADAWARTFLADVGLQVALLTLGTGPTPPPVAVAWPTCVRAHPRIGARVMRAWGLAEPLVVAAEGHHAGASATSPVPIVALVQLADALTGALGLDAGAAIPGGVPEVDEDRAYRDAETVLGVHVTAIGALREEARALLSAQGLLAPAARGRAAG